MSPAVKKGMIAKMGVGVQNPSTRGVEARLSPKPAWATKQDPISKTKNKREKYQEKVSLQSSVTQNETNKKCMPSDPFSWGKREEKKHIFTGPPFRGRGPYSMPLLAENYLFSEHWVLAIQDCQNNVPLKHRVRKFAPKNASMGWLWHYSQFSWRWSKTVIFVL